MTSKRDLHTVYDFTKEEAIQIIERARDIKANPAKYRKQLKGKTVLMLFEKPSLRTRVSLESGTSQMGGHAIFYSIVDSPLGKMKENIHDTSKTASRYVDIIAARLYSKKDFQDLARFSSVPVINLLDDYGHPCQIMADFQTIAEKKDLNGKLKLSFFGDGQNNVTYELMRMCAQFGFDMDIACPNHPGYVPDPLVVEEVNKVAVHTGSVIRVTDNVEEAAKGSDIVYTDTWMSYHIKPDEEVIRKATLQKFQAHNNATMLSATHPGEAEYTVRVTSDIMKTAKSDALFLHCLPATRGNEMTAEVIDGLQSVVFDQAENRLHVQKAIMLFLLGL